MPKDLVQLLVPHKITMVAHTCIPAFSRQRQEDHKFMDIYLTTLGV